MKPGLIRRVVDYIASIPATPVQLGALFATTVLARNLMEAAALGTLFAAPAFFLHFPIAYIFPAAGLVGLLHLFSGYPLGRLLRVMVFTWTLTLLPPLLDLLLGSTSAIGYFPLEKSNAGHFLLNFFNPSVILPGTTAGIRIEAAIGCILAGVFTASVSGNRRLVRGLATTVVFAPVFLVFFTWPYLVYVITSGLFPWAEGAQAYMQWHAVTEPHLTGAAHYTIFLIDSIPVIVTGSWFISILLPEQWKRVASSFTEWLPGLIILLSGSAAALTMAAGSRAATFADAVALMGAASAGLLILVSTRFTGVCRWWVAAAGVVLAGAASWGTLVIAALAVSAGALPGPDRLRAAILYPLLFLLAASPVSISSGAPLVLALVLGSAALCGLLPRRRMTPLILSAAILACSVLGRPVSGGAWLTAQQRTTDTFNRSTRVDFGLVSAGREAAAGGELTRLAETAHLTGMSNRAQWAYSVATWRGDSSSGMLRVGINLTFSSGDPLQFRTLLDRYVALHGDAGTGELIPVLLAHAAREGDLTQLDHLHSLTGPSPELFGAYSRVYLASGDTASALSYSEASIQMPGVTPGQYAWGMDLRALTGGDYRGLFLEAGKRFPGSVDLMTSRLRASITAGDGPDRSDLLQRCLVLDPASGMVLETASAWHLENGSPDSALIFAERAIAASASPRLSAFILACSSAMDSSENALLEIHARYGLSLYPHAAGLQWFLAEALIAQGREDEVSLPVPDN